MSVEHRAEVLVQPAAESYWQATANFPQHIVFQLPGTKPSTITKVVLRSKEGIDTLQLVKDVEVLASLDNKRWHSLASGTFIKTQQQLEIRFPAGNYRFVKVKVYSNWGGTSVALAGIAIE